MAEVPNKSRKSRPRQRTMTKRADYRGNAHSRKGVTFGNEIRYSKHPADLEIDDAYPATSSRIGKAPRRAGEEDRPNQDLLCPRGNSAPPRRYRGLLPGPAQA